MRDDLRASTYQNLNSFVLISKAGHLLADKSVVSEGEVVVGPGMGAGVDGAAV